MHIETLKIFCDLANLRSFSKTAEKHLLSQSAISQQARATGAYAQLSVAGQGKKAAGTDAGGTIVLSGSQGYS